ncbi:MAG: hypothetical protein NT167_25155 [Verrucomicrobia bacterium]|nr:hypothetical protein [Verrucomicrobiota bacterium]
MRILLQSFESGLYLDASGDWTSTSDLARNFANTRQAAEFKIHRRLAGVFVVVLPEPTPPADASNIHDETIWEAHEWANPACRQMKAVQATTTKAGRSIQRVSAVTNHQRVACRRPYNITV